MAELPAKLLDSLANIEGFDIDSFTLAHHQPAPISVRFNHNKLDSYFYLYFLYFHQMVKTFQLMEN
jgi:hypothetical protein